jgi:ABC-2 type transport system permease protein
MFNYRTLAVIKRELREKLMSKSFIIMTILLPVFMFGIIGIQTLLISYEGDSGSKIEIVTQSDEMINSVKEYLAEEEFVKDGSYKIRYNITENIEEYVKSKKTLLVEEKLDGIIFIPNSALKDKKVQYFAKTPNNRTIPDKISSPINKFLIDRYFGTRNLSKEELDFARLGVDFAGFKVSEKEEFEEQGYGNMILAYVFMFLLYFSLLMMGSMTMQSVQEEKNSKIVEVILSSVNSKELLTGKILGASITGALQMFVWLLPVLTIISTSWFVLPPEFTFDITYGHLIYFLINFFFGLVIFLGLFATVGSIFHNAQEAQSGMWPVMMLIMIPFFIALSMMKNPNNEIAEIASFLPFSTIMVMPGKFVLTDVPLWQLFASMFVNVLTVLTIFPLAGKIFRVGILRSGKKPSLTDIIKWLKYKY